MVVYLEDGSQRQSITRHVRRENDVWKGNNPDEQAIAILDAAEKALVMVQRHHEAIKKRFDKETDSAAKMNLQRDLLNADFIIQLKEGRVRELQKSTPRQVQFTF